MYVMLMCCIFFTSLTKAEREISHKVIYFFKSTVLYFVSFFFPLLLCDYKTVNVNFLCLVFLTIFNLTKATETVVRESRSHTGRHALFLCMYVCGLFLRISKIEEVVLFVFQPVYLFEV